MSGRLSAQNLKIFKVHLPELYVRLFCFGFLISWRLKIHRIRIHVWLPLLKVSNGSNVQRACVLCICFFGSLFRRFSRRLKIDENEPMFGRLCSKSQTIQISRQTAHVCPFLWRCAQNLLENAQNMEEVFTCLAFSAQEPKNFCAPHMPVCFCGSLFEILSYVLKKDIQRLVRSRHVCRLCSNFFS